MLVPAAADVKKDPMLVKLSYIHLKVFCSACKIKISEFIHKLEEDFFQ